jgi:hypothetical protein
MNEKTKETLKKFVDEIEILAQGVVLMTGTDSCSKLLDAAEELKKSLDSDETII